LKKNRNWVG